MLMKTRFACSPLRLGRTFFSLFLVEIVLKVMYIVHFVIRYDTVD